jgi:pyruvate,water dikinase
MISKEITRGEPMDWIMWPQEGTADAAVIGGKAKALWTLWQHGFPVPPLFCLTVAAYQQWCQSGKPDLPTTSIQQALHKALEHLTGQISGTERYAVRSSAVAEDTAEASFAGQFHTRLNVPTAQVAEAVVAVWCSAETATAYRTYMQRDPGALAVVVQPMLPAEMAGVMCTADPCSGHPDHLVLNAAWGLGEGVVSGIVTPDHWVIDRASGLIRKQQPGEKGHMVVIAPGGGTTVVATRQPSVRA